MINKMDYQYRPDYVSPPGETLLETIEALGMSQAELAERTGRPKKTINEIIKGKAAITPETAIQLERAIGISAAFWNNREKQFRENLAYHKEMENLSEQVKWLDNFPLKQMSKFGWIKNYKDSVQQLKELLNFLGVVSPDRYKDILIRCEKEQVAWRSSQAFQKDPYAVLAWLRKGEIEAQKINCQAYNQTNFKKSLEVFLGLTRKPPNDFLPEIVNRCASCGVAVVFVPELSGTRTSGATRWLGTKKALMQFSFRYKTDDHFWFTFFHECHHILNHSKRAIFLESLEKNEIKEEAEANIYAANMLIPLDKYKKFLNSKRKDKVDIINFSNWLNIAPGIVVGRLQHDGEIPYSHFNDLKVHLDWNRAT